MKKLAVIYHSAHGHTAHIARHVAATEVHLLQAESLTAKPAALTEFDGYLLGSPTYLDGVSGT